MHLGEELHLTYCTNIHPGHTWSEVQESIEHFGPELKARISPNNPFGIGLRLSNEAAVELLEDDNLIRFQKYLDKENLYIFTLNGFPYGSFHRESVKDAVHSPDWQTPERADYTIRLVHILSRLLPSNLSEGSISTSPLSYKPWVNPNDPALWESCLHQLIKVVIKLILVREKTGQIIHIDLEPEPDGLLEDSGEVVDFFQNHLLVKGVDMLSKSLGITTEKARYYLLDHICICLDTCHMAIEYETPVIFVNRLKKAGIHIGKVQISSALMVNFSSDVNAYEQQKEIKDSLKPFTESTYLHQVIQKNRDLTMIRYPDLPDALTHISQQYEDALEWRIHFHVPIFVEAYALFMSTQKEIIDTLILQNQHPFCRHFEIETYTWEVLPDTLKTDLSNLITKEFEWVINLWSSVKAGNFNEPTIE
ncbi:MAG: metabolite traffic protein EboE [Balneolales bacterium]